MFRKNISSDNENSSGEMPGKEARTINGNYSANETLNSGQNSETESFAKLLIKDAVFCGVIVCAMLCFIRPTIVHQTSMYPTCKPNDYILLEKQAYLFSEPERGDIVVFSSDIEEDGYLIKRIIGTPGEHIVIKDGSVYINDKKLHEEYLSSDVITEHPVDITIPENKYFVLGDNRDVSIDSRYEAVGLVNKNDIYGKAWIRLWPLDTFGLL